MKTAGTGQLPKLADNTRRPALSNPSVFKLVKLKYCVVTSFQVKTNLCFEDVSIRFEAVEDVNTSLLCFGEVGFGRRRRHLIVNDSLF